MEEKRVQTVDVQGRMVLRLLGNRAGISAAD